MLRIILSVTGVGFIALGLFGGGALDGFFNQTNNALPVQATLEKIEVPAVAETDVIASTMASIDADVLVADVPVDDDVVEDALVENSIVAGEISPPKDEGAVVVANPAADNGSIDSAGQTLNASLASADSDLERSTDRNDQVALAETILATAGVPAVEAAAPVVDKSAELSEVLEISTGQLENEILIVMKDKVNMRDGPSIDHPVVLQLEQGQELMEFKREGKWVHVGAYGTSGKIGWVHQRLVGPNQK